MVDTAARFAEQHSTPDRQFLLAAGSAGIEAATNAVVREANRTMLLYVYLAVILVWVLAWMFRSTYIGINLEAAGSKPAALDAAGVSVVTTRACAVLSTGFLAGVGGAYLANVGAGIFVPFMTGGWEHDDRWSWAVCDATTAELLAGIVVRDVDHELKTAEVTCWTQPGHRDGDVLPAALNSVLGWVYGAMEMHRITYRHAVSDKASQRVAEQCGFTLQGRLRDEAIVGDQREDVLLWSRAATDPQPEQLR